MADDPVSLAIGDFGKWQLKISIMLSFLKFSVGWFQMNIAFLAPPQKYWCKTEDFSDLELLKNTTDTGDQCKIISDGHEIPCVEFLYDDSIFTSTIISEWDLVCSRKFYVEFTQMSFMGGVLLGFLVFGILADRYGRRKLLITAIIMQAIASFLSTFSPWYSLFILLRFFLAISSGGIATISFVLCTEIVGGKWRTIIPVFYQMPYALGYVILSGLSFTFRNWRHLQLSLSILSSLYIFFITSIPESPRWLLITGQKEQAIVMMKKAAIVNKKSSVIDEALFEKTSRLNGIQNAAEKRNSTMLLFRSRRLRFIIIILCIEWLGVGISFYAFNQYLGTLSRNLFIIYAVDGLMAVPGIFICQIVSHYCSRKTTIGVFQILTAIIFLLILAVPKGFYYQDWPRIVLSGLGTVCLSIFVPNLFLYSSELFPTIVRNAGIGIVLMMSKIGPILAPLILSLERISTYLPLTFLGIFTAGLTTLLILLPETKGKRISDDLKENDIRGDN